MFFLIMARYRLNTSKYVLKWPKKHQEVPKFNKKNMSTLSKPPLHPQARTLKLNQYMRSSGISSYFNPF